MSNVELARHIEILRKLRRIVEATTKDLVPADPSALDAEAIAQRRWQIHLSILVNDVSRSVERLAKVNEVRSCIILARCLYEYRLRSAWCIKNPDKAVSLYHTIPKRHYSDMGRLPALPADAEAEMANDYLEWRKSADLTGESLGVPGVVAMSVELSEAAERLTDANGRQYTHEETMSNALPSWYVHGSPQLIFEQYEDWQNISDWSYAEQPRTIRLMTLIRHAIGTVAIFLIVLRTEYGMDTDKVKNLFGRTLEIAPS